MLMLYTGFCIDENIVLLVNHCSNLAFGLIGRLMADHYHKGVSFEKYVQRFILEPLGLKDTGFSYTDE